MTSRGACPALICEKIQDPKMWPILKLVSPAKNQCCGSVSLASAEIMKCLSARSLHHFLPQSRSVPRSLHTSRSTNQSSGNNHRPGKSKFFYIPNPFMWLHYRMELAVLKRDWDPSFDLASFKFGAGQAVCTVTELVSRREWGEMCGLLTQKAVDKLRATTWTLDQRENLVLSPDNIQMIYITSVSLQSIVDNKYCDIDLTVLGTRTPHNLDKHSMVILEFFVRFHREYTAEKLPDWTISKFDLKSFKALPRKDET